MDYYIALIDRAQKSGVYGIVFPDFPGCTSGGDSLEAIHASGTEALAAHVAVMRERGEAIPAPSDFAGVVKIAEQGWLDLKGSVAALIPLLPPPARAVRVNITLDERLLERIDAAADNRSRFLAEAAEARLIAKPAPRPAPRRAEKRRRA